jgi:hypothetical protein
LIFQPRLVKHGKNTRPKGALFLWSYSSEFGTDTNPTKSSRLYSPGATIHFGHFENCRSGRRRRPVDLEKFFAGLLSPPPKNFRQDIYIDPGR